MCEQTSQRLPDGTFPKYVYGLAGIAELFSVSKQTALNYKKTILQEAVSQYGQIIVTDTEKAFKCFLNRSRKKREVRQ